MTKQDLFTKLREIQDNYELFNNLEEILKRPEDNELHEKYTLGVIPEFLIKFTNRNTFNYILTYNGFGDIQIEDIDKRIKELERKKEILIELEPYRGIELGDE